MQLIGCYMNFRGKTECKTQKGFEYDTVPSSKTFPNCGLILLCGKSTRQAMCVYRNNAKLSLNNYCREDVLHILSVCVGVCVCMRVCMRVCVCV